MTCRQAMQWMDAFLDGEASAEGRRERFAAHLERCAACSGQWNALRLAESALRAPRPVPAPEGLLQDFRRALAAAEPRQGRAIAPPAFGAFLRWLLPAGAFAAAVLLLLAIPRGAFVPPRSAQPTGPEMARAQPPPATDEPIRDSIAAPEPVPPPVAPPYGYERPPDSARPAAVRQPVSARAEGRQGSASRRSRQTMMKGPDARSAAAPRRDERALPELSFATRERLAAPRGGLGEMPAGGSGGVSIPSVTTAYGDTLPPEFDVSPALLTALQRPVETEGRASTVQAAVRELSLYADIVVEVDSIAGQRPVAMEQGERPLWQALEAVARQGSLQVYPVDNQLVLRAFPARAAVMARAKRLEDAPRPAPPVAPERRLAVRAQAAGGARGPAGASKAIAPRGPAEGLEPPAAVRPSPQSLYHLRTVDAANAARPDPSVWPALWGTLPERGFVPPTPEDLPPVPRPASERSRSGGRQQP